jgi:hypothetical protein
MAETSAEKPKRPVVILSASTYENDWIQRVADVMEGNQIPVLTVNLNDPEVDIDAILARRPRSVIYSRDTTDYYDANDT